MELLSRIRGGDVLSSSVIGRQVVKIGMHGGGFQRTGRVDWVFFRTWSRYPLIMLEIEGGRYLRTSAEVISGKVVRKPASIAPQRVDRAGDSIATCSNAIRWPMVV